MSELDAQAVGADPAADASGSNRPVDAARRLERARENLADLEAEIERTGEETVRAAADAARTAADLLDSYSDRAVGTGRQTFAAYVELEAKFESLVDSLPEDVDDERRAAFEAAYEAIDKRRLSEADFERAEAALEPALSAAELLDDREAAREELGAAKTAANRRRGEVESAIAERERLLELASVDLDAPVERIRDPIETYNAAVEAAFDDFVSTASAREVFAFLERARWYPLVGYDRPPEELRTYVESSDAGTHAIPELLEYAEYTRSKLAHVVDDADELKRRIATRRTSLERIDADPLTVAWPPKPAAELRYRLRELRPLVARVADAETVALLRDVRAVTRDPEYDRLQTAAQAKAQLSAAEREAVLDGRAEDELEELRDERERLETALDAA